ncbi:SigE family RNA polymerase sigma factor [Dactylosporangium sp. CA-052675]|uniref:SigE family RNA polymerase sigma factor n=1 Tax=unclassified Dactylosporangium TaxID=2621675 RepID=UPI003333BE76|nr:SigE family RNA polymerase sigma factor [Dactylosporangium thailandense]
MTDRDTAFAEYFAARSDAMRGTAFLLCGDWHRAEDLTQTAFTKLYLAWNRVSRHEVLDGYLRRTLVRTYLDERRLGWWRRVRTSDTPPEPPTVDTGPEERVAVLAALSAVPARQRAVLILRYWEDLSVEETAELLGCSAGTVKSQAARGLQTLRARLSPTFTTD